MMGPIERARRDGRPEPLMMRCVGSGYPVCTVTRAMLVGAPVSTLCKMCGEVVATTADGDAVAHDRADVLGMIARGDFG